MGFCWWVDKRFPFFHSCQAVITLEWQICENPGMTTNILTSFHKSLLMSLLIWYWRIPFYFCCYITFSLLWIPQPCDAPVQPPMWPPWAFAITHSPCLSSIASLIHCTIGLALHMECTGDLRTSLLHFPLWTGPHVVFLMIIPFSDLLIHHCDMWQFCPVTQLIPTHANQFQVIAPHSQWVRELLLFRCKWSLFSFFLDKSFCI